MSTIEAIRKGWKGFAWYVKGVMGENAYQQYVDHHNRTHASAPLMTEREFWRDRTDRQERNPQGRCC
jgi:uncharacterized short protein YbdD (DUF466 family)